MARRALRRSWNPLDHPRNPNNGKFVRKGSPEAYAWAAGVDKQLAARGETTLAQRRQDEAKDRSARIRSQAPGGSDAARAGEGRKGAWADLLSDKMGQRSGGGAAPAKQAPAKITPPPVQKPGLQPRDRVKVGFTEGELIRVDGKNAIVRLDSATGPKAPHRVPLSEVTKVDPKPDQPKVSNPTGAETPREKIAKRVRDYTDPAAVRVDLRSLSVPDLKTVAKDLDIKPGKAGRAELVDMIANRRINNPELFSDEAKAFHNPDQHERGKELLSRGSVGQLTGIARELGLGTKVPQRPTRPALDQILSGYMGRRRREAGTPSGDDQIDTPAGAKPDKTSKPVTHPNLWRTAVDPEKTRREGLQAASVGWEGAGSYFGSGVYLNTDKSDSDTFAWGERMFGAGRAEQLRAQARVENPFVVQARPGDADSRKVMQRALEDAGVVKPGEKVSVEEFTRRLQARGHDGVEVKGAKGNDHLAGNQLVVFDPADAELKPSDRRSDTPSGTGADKGGILGDSGGSRRTSTPGGDTMDTTPSTPRRSTTRKANRPAGLPDNARPIKDSDGNTFGYSAKTTREGTNEWDLYDTEGNQIDKAYRSGDVRPIMESRKPTTPSTTTGGGTPPGGWVSKTTGRPVSDPSQVDIVRGDVVPAPTKDTGPRSDTTSQGVTSGNIERHNVGGGRGTVARSGDRYKATNPRGFSSFFDNETDAKMYAEGKSHAEIEKAKIGNTPTPAIPKGKQLTRRRAYAGQPAVAVTRGGQELKGIIGGWGSTTVYFTPEGGRRRSFFTGDVTLYERA